MRSARLYHNLDRRCTAANHISRDLRISPDLRRFHANTEHMVSHDHRAAPQPPSSTVCLPVFHSMHAHYACTDPESRQTSLGNGVGAAVCRSEPACAGPPGEGCSAVLRPSVVSGGRRLGDISPTDSGHAAVMEHRGGAASGVDVAPTEGQSPLRCCRRECVRRPSAWV